MKAVVYRGKGRVEVVSVPKPKISETDVLLKIKSVGLCGTDLHIYNGGTSVMPGTIIGHEFSGVVAAVGKNVKNVRVGSRVVAEHVISCRACYYCLRGKPNLCVRAQVLGMHRAGALAEYMTVPSELVYPYSATIPFDEAALIEPLTIALFAASQAGFLLEKRVAVVGQGPIGILLDQVLTAAGAHVIGIDVLDSRLAFAKKCGWVHSVVKAGDKRFKEKLKSFAPLGVDASFEAVGKEVTAEMCLEITKRDGDVYLLGVFEQPSRLNLMKLIKKELNVYGSWTCSFSFSAAIDLLVAKKVNLKSLITNRYPVEDAVRAFADASSYAGKRMKTIIYFPD